MCVYFLHQAEDNLFVSLCDVFCHYVFNLYIEEAIKNFKENMDTGIEI